MLFNNCIIPENPVLITFDDSDISVYNNGFSVLKKHDIPAILLVITDLIVTKKPFWWNEIKYYLDEVNGNKKVWEVKKWPNKDRELYIENLII
jgi:peptidoglycan/xylan/chitin deacetylase (PgdA/CDA1 family)